jgi:hypothetical protein
VSDVDKGRKANLMVRAISARYSTYVKIVKFCAALPIALDTLIIYMTNIFSSLF